MPILHVGSHRFDSDYLHYEKIYENMKVRVYFQTTNPSWFKKEIQEVFHQHPSHKWVHFPTQKKRYTVLRSPHVNKKSRQQFEFRILKKGLLFNDLSKQDYQRLIKTLKTFHGVQIRVDTVWRNSFEFVQN
uniref:Ribosomal protein S10 n=1 Tax=Chloropicon maureeniae TaxID=1461542 RepID=A0A4D6C711_9CHLO|nr:ribosomal protein S10 [Chloropicon maureeniae]QBX98819.1 ribosomal protein S10 [Chloropicon maureeniae]